MNRLRYLSRSLTQASISWLADAGQEIVETLNFGRSLILVNLLIWFVALAIIIGMFQAPSMIVCDKCKDIKARKVRLVKVRVTVVESMRDRDVITAERHICDGCLSAFNSSLGHAINDLLKPKKLDESQPVPGQQPEDRGLRSERNPRSPWEP